MRLASAGLVLGVLVLGACGGDEPAVSERASALLQAQVDAVRSAAGSRDRAATAEQLARLRTSARDLRARGDLTNEAARRIDTAADAVEAELVRIPLPTTTTTTTTRPWSDEDDDERGPRRHERGPEKPPKPGKPGKHWDDDED